MHYRRLRIKGKKYLFPILKGKLLYINIKRIRATPEAVLELIYGLKAANALIRLEKLGYVHRVEVNGIRFWFDKNYDYFDPLILETKAWFVARLEEAGGKYEDEYGISPKGNRLRFKFSSRGVYIIVEENQNFFAETNEENRMFFAETEDLNTLLKRRLFKGGIK